MSSLPYIAQLRAVVGNRMLWLATARAATIDGRGRVLLGRYHHSDTWTLPGGIIEPAEQPADSAARECYEETGTLAIPEVLTSVTVSGLVAHAGGATSRHLDLTFRCRPVHTEADARDGEFEEVQWHAIQALPKLSEYDTELLSHAISSAGQTAYAFSGLNEIVRVATATASLKAAVPDNKGSHS